MPQTKQTYNTPLCVSGKKTFINVDPLNSVLKRKPIRVRNAGECKGI